eukprot:GSChrysophyteH1.ASY1.ANO1.58.1 assembled CDS
MGGGASSFKMHASKASAVSRPSWLASPQERIMPLNQKKFTDLVAVGKGKFGYVFLSKHEAQGKCAAIKYIHKEYIEECKSVDRIRNEIEIVKKLDHPFVIHCFGGFDTPACTALVFEYSSGGELFTHMKKTGKMNEQHAKFYFCEMASALNYLHNTVGIVYRDLKPENVLLDYAGHCQLIDFGFAVPVSNGSSLHDGCGTAMYVAPEIASGFSKSSHGFPVDWWGLGCVLAEMVTGHAPFGDTDNTSKFEIFTNITEKAPSLSISMSGPIKECIRGLLEKDQKKRWSWNKVQSCGFCKDVDWSDLESRSITPPWVPKASPSPSSDNFVSWNDLVVPAKAASITTNQYCASLDPAKGGCRTSRNSCGMESPTPKSSPVVRSRANSDVSLSSGRNSPTLPGSPAVQGRKSFNKKIGSPTDSPVRTQKKSLRS